jgi:uncharacterized membrane protein YbaN (DUF454 family)
VTGHHRYVKSDVLRAVLIVAGWLSVVAGIAGVFLPLVPTVPFLLLAVACFARSSQRFHDWLVEHAYFGPLVRDYLNSGGIPRKAKVMALCMVWVSFPVSTLFFARVLWLKILLIATAVGITVYLVLLPAAKPENNGVSLE